MFGAIETNFFDLGRFHPASQPGHVVVRIMVIVALTLVAHLLVLLVRFISDWLVRKSAAKKSPVGFVLHQPKFITLTRLIASGLTFIIYSVAIGFVLGAFGLDPKKFLTTYLATASVIGLAVGFGSQGLVQDVVTGLTLILSNTLDVGDLIEISGQIGRVERVGLRFTELTNFYNQQVFVPNRTITTIARFPRGGINAYADVQIPPGADSLKTGEIIRRIASGVGNEFSAVILGEPEVSESETAIPDGWRFLRVQFRIWPGQGALIETTFRQRILEAMKALEPNYAEWMIAVTYRAIGASAHQNIGGKGI